MGTRNVSPLLKAGASVRPFRFVKVDSAATHQGLEADANERVIGVSSPGSARAPGVDSDSQYHAVTNDSIELLGLGDLARLMIGDTVSAGNLLKSDAEGRGVPIASEGNAQNVGAVALRSGVLGDIIEVQVLIFSVDPTSDASIQYSDDEPIIVGTGSDAYMLWSTADNSNHAFVLGLGDDNQAFHITDKGARATDWNISATTDPNVYIHSNTTPATDYLRLGGHSGSAADIDLVGGATLNFAIDGTAEMTMTAGGLQVADANGILVGGSTAQVISDGDGSTNLTPLTQILGTAKADASLLIAGFNTTDDATVAPVLAFLKSGNASIGSKTIVASGEILGEVLFFGDDGVDYESAAAGIRGVVDTTPGAGDMPGRLVFLTSADSGETLTEVFRCTSAQNLCVADTNGLIVGGNTQQTISDGDGSTNLIPEVQVLGTAKADSSMLLGCWNTTDSIGPTLTFLKSGHATIGSNTAVAADELLGEIVFFGADGTDFESPGGAIRCFVDAAVGTGDMPGRLVFLTTADGGETLTEAMRINSAQNVIIGNNNALLVGHATPQVAGATYETQVLGTALADSSVLLGCWNATDTVRSELAFLKSGNGTIGSNTIVASNENLGGIVWYTDDGVDYTSVAASIEGIALATQGSNDSPGAIQINCTADSAAAAAEVGRFTNANGLTLGVTGTKLGKLQFCGNTSGVITVNSAAAAGTWTLTLPPDDGDAGEQLQTDGSGVTTWEAAGSMRAVKKVIAEVSNKADEVLAKLLGTGVYQFTYDPEAKHHTTRDFTTVYTGVMAEELNDVMHHNGKIFSPVSAFGLAVLAIKALAEKVARLEAAALA